MTANEAIKSIKVMLGVAPVGETVDTLVEDVKLAAATLMDGTKFEADGEFEVGKQAFVITSEGERVEAPEGKHETTDGIVFTTDRVGVITAIDEVEDGEAKEVEEVESEVELETEETEETISLSAEAIDSLVESLNSIQSGLENLESRINATQEEFHAFKDEPAAAKITNNLDDVQKVQGDMAKARFDKILQFRQETSKFNPIKTK
jgi:gamma-glutamylcyclotransferase (GGCT)/AIG2-like uncharacterized protein YtfP